MKKVLVTGGTGFLGANVVASFKKSKKYQVHSCSRKEGVDLRDYKELTSFIGTIKPDILVHCAAHVGGIAYDDMYPIEIFEDNLMIGLNTVKAVAENNISCFLNMMPNCTYPSKFDKSREEDWWNGEMHPSTVVYGFPRKMMEVACFAYLKKYQFRVVHLIFPNLYGPGDHFDPVLSHALGGLISKIVSAQENNKKYIEIWGTGQPVREWLYVEDAANVVFLVLENINEIENNEILNIGTDKGISIADLAEAIRDVVGWDGEFVFDRCKPDGAKVKILSSTKLKNYIHWTPDYSLLEGIERTIHWYKSNGVTDHRKNKRSSKNLVNNN